MIRKDEVMNETNSQAVKPGSEIATLAGGCFWCLEAVFEGLNGVEQVRSGYIGGSKPNPTYHQICSGTTGHAEAVELVFDPAIVSYKEVLEVFFAIHDPTTPNRQGNDVGTQYRSAIYYHSPEQKAVAEQVIAALAAERVFRDPIVTEVTPASTFFVAEAYHQEYYRNNGGQPYCAFVVAPKVAKFRQKFGAMMKKG